MCPDIMYYISVGIILKGDVFMEYIAKYDKQKRTLSVSIKTKNKKKIKGVLNSLKGQNIANVDKINPQNLSFEIHNCPDANWKEDTDGTGVFDAAKSAMEAVQTCFENGECHPKKTLTRTARSFADPSLYSVWGEKFAFGGW